MGTKLKLKMQEFQLEKNLSRHVICGTHADPTGALRLWLCC